MASTEALAVERLEALTPDALADLLQLVADSHWNQVAADWELFFSAGAVYVVRGAQGRIVASGAVLPMGASQGGAARVAWISMILVTPSQRGAGLGRAVFARCLAHVQGEGRIAMLDATPAGEQLYAKFGFEPHWRFTRWRRPTLHGASAALPLEASLDRIESLDRQALGFDRRAVLRDIALREGAACLQFGEALAVLRPGRTATQIGPMLAADESEAATLLQRLAAALPQVLVVDVPQGRAAMEAALQAAGFAPERPFARMALAAGLALPPTHTETIQAVAGPEYA
jgi:GNAT superfamily N-acetyltransferase